MKRLTVFLSALLLMPASAIADVRNVQTLQQRSDGTFQVTCLDRRIETVSADQILQNNVCKPIRIERRRSRNHDGYNPGQRYPDDRFSNNASVVCSGDDFFDQYYITRIADGKKIGEKMPLAQCRKVISSARRGVICSGDNFFNWFYLTRISDEKRLGDRTSLDQCLVLVNDIR